MKPLLQRQAAIEACIVESLEQGPQNGTQIRQYVQARPSCVWAPSKLIRDTVERMLRLNRVELHYEGMRAVPCFRLPTDPELPFARHSKLSRKPIFTDLDFPNEHKLPRWFHILGSRDLDEQARTRSGYDVQSDYNRF